MRLRLLTGYEGNSQICKNLFLRRWQEITHDESQGLDRQFLGGVELDGTRGSDDLRKDQRSSPPFPRPFARYLVCVERVQWVRVFLQGQGRSLDFRLCSEDLVGHRAGGEGARLSCLGKV